MKNEKEAAIVLGCSVAALRKWRLLGKGPAYCKVGRLVRYAAGDLQAYLEAHRVQPVGAAIESRIIQLQTAQNKRPACDKKANRSPRE
jgi:hypothetical protein